MLIVEEKGVEEFLVTQPSTEKWKWSPFFTLLKNWDTFDSYTNNQLTWYHLAAAVFFRPSLSAELLGADDFGSTFESQ